MCVFPSDHYIKNEEVFINVLNDSIEIAEKEDKLVTIGITPTYSATGYGYINFEQNIDSSYKGIGFPVKDSHATIVAPSEE